MAEIILGIDHGNGNMKGSNVDFPCGLVRYTSEPGRFMNEDILEYCEATDIKFKRYYRISSSG